MLNDLEMDKYLRQWWQDNADQIEFSELKLFKTKDMFTRLMSEKNNLSKTTDEQISMLTDIAYGYAINEKENATFNRYADNKHLNYFDIFLEDGERGRIQDALNYNGISTDILKGIKKNIQYDASTKLPDGRTVRVIQETEPPSNTISYFEIDVDGQVIYAWNRSMGEYEYEDFTSFDDYYEPEYDDTPKIEVIYNVTESEKTTKSNYVQSYKLTSGEVINERVSKSGRTFYQDSKGHFTKKPI